MQVTDIDSEVNSLRTGVESEELVFHKVNSNEISYGDFFKKYLLKNIPCVVSNVSKDWYCQRYWVNEDKPNIEFIQDHYGSCEVPIADCGEKYYNAQNKTKMPLESFLNYCRQQRANNYPKDVPCLYLKDWHFTRDYPEEEVYRVPEFFCSDWLNEYFLNTPELNDDYRFVYMGPKGSWTPLHTDVFSSFSWSVNICGKKKWVFFPPSQGEFLKDRLGNLMYDVEGDRSVYPRYGEVEHRVELEQGAGDAVFVPSGWFHQVWNQEDTISINQNWVNGCNIRVMSASLEHHLAQVQREIADCREEGVGSPETRACWDEQCQRILKATFGLDYPQWLSFLLFIAERRLAALRAGSPLTVPGGWLLGPNHLAFDLTQLLPVLQRTLALSIPSLASSTPVANHVIQSISTLLASLPSA